MLKLVCISDTHNVKFDLPKGDILVHCGDLTGLGTLSEIISGLDWLSKFRDQYREILFVAGNHDRLAEQNPTLFRVLCEERRITWLNNEGVEINGIYFYGSSWQVSFNNWAFNKTLEELEVFWKNMPDKVDVLITHEPPYGILDYVINDHRNIGDRFLLQRVYEVRPQWHFFGHNHDSPGIKEFDGIKFCNAAMLNDRYVKTREPIEVEL